ncbi:MAG TPA: hypothetical protein VKE70_16500 [Candidatus Solibacter sp.]|nr:hypothetical protein [Candidatus Solibacter sp.]
MKALDALRLCLIEHAPDGKLFPGNIDPHLDRAGCDRGKLLWLTHLKKPGAKPEVYQRAADFLDAADKPLAETVLEDGRKAYPDDKRWAMAFGRHYAQVLLGSLEPLADCNVVRSVSAKEAHTVRRKCSCKADAIE